MNRTETSQLLTLIALVDNRPITPEVVVMWHELLDGITYQEAVDAMKRYYRENSKWLMPAHLVQIVENARRDQKREPARNRRLWREWLDARGIDWVRFEAGDPETLAAVEAAKQRQVQA